MSSSTMYDLITFEFSRARDFCFENEKMKSKLLNVNIEEQQLSFYITYFIWINIDFNITIICNYKSNIMEK